MSTFEQSVSGEGLLVTDGAEVVAEPLPPGGGVDECGVSLGLVAVARRGQLEARCLK